MCLKNFPVSPQADLGVQRERERVIAGIPAVFLTKEELEIAVELLKKEQKEKGKESHIPLQNIWDDRLLELRDKRWKLIVRGQALQQRAHEIKQTGVRALPFQQLENCMKTNVGSFRRIVSILKERQIATRLPLPGGIETDKYKRAFETWSKGRFPELGYEYVTLT